jgi:predicted DNA-binding protein YlxM (UPF0122 family)
MNKVDEKIVLIELYDLYQDLLTDKQKGYFEAAYFDDSSITEMANEFEVSRNAIHDQLKKTINKLYDIEVAVNLRKTNKKQEELFASIRKQETKEQIVALIEEYEKVE